MIKDSLKRYFFSFFLKILIILNSLKMFKVGIKVGTVYIFFYFIVKKLSL